MNEEQKLRLNLLEACGYNIDTAQKCLDFVLNDNKVNKQEPDYIMADGVYLIDTTGNAVRYNGRNIVKSIEYIGIIQGNRSLAIALRDVNEKEIPLTLKESNKDYSCYVNNYMDAVQDWSGQQNTKHLKTVELNPAIQLEEGEYIPSLAELYLICLNCKAINEAIRFVGGQDLKGWYWSSTESSTTHAWYLNLTYGTAYNYTKTTTTNRVRLVKKFL